MLLFIAGIAYLVNSFALIVVPKIAALLFPAILLPPLVAETLLAVWMVAKGVNANGWNAAIARGRGEAQTPY